MHILTIDTGTTNTRTKLWSEGEVVAFSSIEVGVRDTSITGSKEKLQAGVKQAIVETLSNAKCDADQVDLFLAAGMITSNVGLIEVPHVVAPAGVMDLAEGMASANIPEVLDWPIWFVPGIKNDVPTVTPENCEAMDIMRGEEVETFGILEHVGTKGPALLILPGSHTKFVHVDEKGQVTACVTTIAGELLSVITNGTILASALNHSFATTVDEKMVLLGAAEVQAVGLNRTCFSVRILDQFTDLSYEEKASYLAGAVVGTDLMAIKGSHAVGDCRDIPVIVGGTNSLATVFSTLIGKEDHFRGGVNAIDDTVMKDISGSGAIMIAQARGLL